MPEVTRSSHSAEQTQEKRPTKGPWSLWVIALLGGAAVIVLRIAETGRVWAAPWDPLPSERAMGPGGIVLNWLAGALLIGAGWHTVHLAVISRHSRRRFATAAFGLIAMGALALFSTRSVFSRHFVSDVERASRPVVAALEEYRQDHDSYPPRLDDLVPRYLGAVPSVGYGSRRELQYYRAGAPPPANKAKAWADRYRAMWVGTAAYALVVERVPGGTLVFRPTGKYDDLPGGRRLRGSRWGATYVD